MKKEYEAAELKITVYELTDVIAASGDDNREENESERIGDLFW